MRNLTDRAIDDHSTPPAPAGEDIVAGEELPEPEPLRPLFSAGPWGVTAALLAFLLPIVASSRVASISFTPKYFVLLLAAGVGFVPLLLAARTGRSAWPARAALCFLGVGLVSVLLSQSRTVGFFGLYDWGNGWLFWLGCAGAFAIGTRCRGKDLDWLAGGLLAGAAVNAAFAVYQSVGHPTSAGFGLYDGTQADGLLGNPVHLEALLLGAIALASVRAISSPAKWGALLLLLGVALEFTTERLAVLLLVILIAYLVVRYRLKGLVVGAITCVGFAIGYLSTSGSLGTRISEGTSSTTFGLRFDIWRVALEVLPHRFLIGYGPGQTLGATTPHIGADFAEKLGPGRLFTDAHDLIIEVLVTTGVLGLLAFLAWIGGALALARGPLVLMALGIFAVELVEPLNLGVTPLAFLALGAATAVPLMRPSDGDAAGEVAVSTAPPPTSVVTRLALTVLVLGSVALGGTMVVADVDSAHAPPSGYVLSDAEHANDLAPYWAQTALALGTMYRYLSAVEHGLPIRLRDTRTAAHWVNVAVSRDPADPSLLASAGLIFAGLGEDHEALSLYRRSLERYRYESDAMLGLGLLYYGEHRYSLSESWLRHALSEKMPADERRAAEHTVGLDRRALGTLGS